MKLDDKQMRKSYEDEFYYLQGSRRQPIKGILIYEQARKKLDISESGKLYRQKWWNYIPIVGQFSAIAYANNCLGKVKCLRNKDAALFQGSRALVNWFSFLFWPIIIIGLWILFSYVMLDFSNGQPVNSTLPDTGIGTFGVQFGKNGAYSGLWKTLLIDRLNEYQSISNAATFFSAFSTFFDGLAKIFIFPILSGPYWGEAPANLIFILIFVAISIINPVNIFNSLVLNSAQLRFTIVYETSAIYRYR